MNVPPTTRIDRVFCVVSGPCPNQALQSYHAFRTLGETKSIFLLPAHFQWTKKSSFLSPTNLPTWSDWVVIGTGPVTHINLALNLWVEGETYMESRHVRIQTYVARERAA